jgi:hypothetical protein
MLDERRTRFAVSAVAFLTAIVCLGAVGLAGAADSQAPRLSVGYQGGRLSVDAHGASLAQVLTQIGARVGFSVLDNGSSSPAVDIAIENAPVDEVLRRLLRGENHTVLYLAEGPGPSNSVRIDRIVLLGPRSEPGGPTDGNSSSTRRIPQVGGAAASAPPATPSPAASTGPAGVSEVLASPSFDQVIAAGGGAGDGDLNTPTVVGDLLRAHAMSALAAGQAGGVEAATAAAPLSVEASLAETTRIAQQNLAALVESLAAVTRSLQESSAKSSK